MKLSVRLQAIADDIHEAETVADIGTDHGLLPIFLYQKRQLEKIILSDINAGPLEKARANIELYAKDGDFDLRQGSGLCPLTPKEVDTVVIAGMGGLLIRDILGENLKKSKTYEHFVLQPRNASEKLREWLFENGFSVENETLVREGRFICEIIKVCPKELFPGKPSGFGMDEKLPEPLDYELPPFLFLKKDPLLSEFIERKIAVTQKVIREIESGTDAQKEEIERLKEREERLRKKLR